MTGQAQSGRLDKIRCLILLDEVLAYALPCPKCNTNEISQHCSLSKSQVWKTPKQIKHSSIPSNISTGFSGQGCQSTLCNVVMNRIEALLIILADIMSMDEACILWNSKYNRQSAHYWALLNPECFTNDQHHMRFALIFGVRFTITS